MGAQAFEYAPREERRSQSPKVRANPSPSIIALRRKPETPRSLQEYLAFCQRPYRIDDKCTMARQLFDAISQYPDIYSQEPRAHGIPMHRYHSVAIWPEINKDRPLTEVNLVCRQGQYLQLFSIYPRDPRKNLPEHRKDILRDKKELLQKARQFFFYNFGAESSAYVLDGCKDCYERIAIVSELPKAYRNYFHGRP